MKPPISQISDTVDHFVSDLHTDHITRTIGPLLDLNFELFIFKLTFKMLLKVIIMSTFFLFPIESIQKNHSCCLRAEQKWKKRCWFICEMHLTEKGRRGDGT